MDPMDPDAGAVAEAFNRLRAADREVLALVVWEGLKPREGAKALGITAAQFSVRLHRAKQRLRKEVIGAGHLPNEAEGISRPASSQPTKARIQ